MAAPAFELPSPEDGLQLHRRLLDGDPTAPPDLARAYLDQLIAWLRRTNPRVAEDYCTEAAGEAIVNLIKAPRSYDPDRQELLVYLRMSAQGDLRNLLRSESRHHRGRRDWKAVEDSPEAGKYLGRDDDPALGLCIAEEEAAIRAVISAEVSDGLSERERRVLELILRGEHRTPVFAEAYGVAHLPKKEQAKEVKRVKDRVKKRLERAGGGHV